jgi:bifunctional UDP-N-acetylglucosamine pyrophosphorylase/glucosamine-1-phosphate N-acetyltransferase
MADRSPGGDSAAVSRPEPPVPGWIRVVSSRDGSNARERDLTALSGFRWAHPVVSVNDTQLKAFREARAAVVGDATIGAGTNIGAGMIFANYDGADKNHTLVGENAFVGSNTVLVAPVTIGDGAYTAAGSVISEDVSAGDLGIVRGRQHNSDWWVLRNRQGTRSAEAATRTRSDESR